MVRGEKAVRRYLQNISNHLICSNNTKQELMEGLTQEVHGFQEAHPEVTEPELVQHFGTVVEVSHSLQECVDPLEAQGNRKAKTLNRVLIVALALIILLPIILVAVAIFLFSNARQTSTTSVADISLVESSLRLFLSGWPLV